jgi:hypothetical protein
MQYDGKIISKMILSEGYPPDWNSTNVLKIGILSSNKIDETKLWMFYNLTKDNAGYKNSKHIFNTKYDYYFFLVPSIKPISPLDPELDGIGKPGLDRNTIIPIENPKNLIKVTRFTIYKDQPVTAYVYIWEK